KSAAVQTPTASNTKATAADASAIISVARTPHFTGTVIILSARSPSSSKMSISNSRLTTNSANDPTNHRLSRDVYSDWNITGRQHRSAVRTPLNTAHLATTTL